ncbi:ATP-binding cassette domain-containing protein [Lapidilactobacillus bayanensis]|uniref:ATP-binding cassette domain-containing protein n=1 Tax=Lapidilactobacillus bayanensis TaxID=2485998 RepID=UPI0013DE6528|nr:ABC transporter ATP-binding protein [Lapidilactobacillus bayanensis]
MNYLTRKPWWLILDVVLSLLAAGFLTLYAYALQLIVDIATGKINLTFAVAAPLLLGYLVLQAVTDGLAKYHRKWFPQQIGRWLRHDLFAKLMRLNFTQTEAGRDVARLTKQVDVAVESYYEVVLLVSYLVLQLIVAAIGTLLISPMITLGIVLLGLPALIFPFLLNRRLQQAKTQVIDTVTRYTAFLTDTFQGLTTIRYALAQPLFTARHAKHNSAVTMVTTREQKLQIITSGIADFLSDFMYLGTWILGAWFVMKGTINLGQLVAFSQLSALLNWPLLQLLEALPELAGGRAAITTLTDFLAQPDQAVRPRQSLALTEPLFIVNHAAVTLDSRQVLADINLTIGPQEKIVVVGASGSGKTSLVRLLTGDLALTAGQVLLSGQPVAKLNQLDVFQRIGMMSQRSELFTGTVRENVTLFDPKYQDTTVDQALTRAGLAAWRASVTLTTKLSPQSPLVSGGERQRLALARLLLRDYRFFIFDELTTGLDPAVAARLEQDLFAMSAGFLLITHQYDAASFAKADRIIVLHAGRIQATGDLTDAAVQAGLHQLGMC